MRTASVRNNQTPGTPGRLPLAISEAGGDAGSIRLIQETLRSTILEVTLYVSDEMQIDEI